MESETTTILLVEDNDGDARLVQELLAETGSNYALTRIERLDQVAKYLVRQGFDVILLDLSLPDASGIATLDNVKEVAPELPIVVLSGMQDEALALRAVHHGAQDYLVKGQGNGELLNRALKYAIERKRSELRLTHLAQYDQLTGLPNRLLFRERLERALHMANRRQRMLAVMFLDIDQFKNVNDSLGHDAGDVLLRTAAERLNHCIRKEDTIARMGGDEFTVILEEITKKEDAAIVAQNICDLMAKPFMVAGQEVFVGASIGIAIFPDNGTTADTLLKEADTALYAVKEQGRGTYQFHEKRMNAVVAERLNALKQLRCAMEYQQFELHYQPQFDLTTSQLVGVEALLRWRHPEQGLIPSGKFIPLLEEKGLISQVGEWAIRSACQQLRQWQQAALPPMQMGINLSSRQFRHSDLVERIGAILEETGVEAAHLQLEISETLLLEGTPSAIAMLNELKELGVGLSIDGFGSGYASLLYMGKFPFDTLKLDPAFIREIVSAPKGGAIISAVIALAHSLDLKVVAVGVEIQSQLPMLSDGDCDLVQGYLFSNPLPAADCTARLQERKRNRYNTHPS